MIGVIFGIFVCLLFSNHNKIRSYEVSPEEDCPCCHGTGIIQLNNNETVECPCTEKWE